MESLHHLCLLEVTIKLIKLVEPELIPCLIRITPRYRSTPSSQTPRLFLLRQSVRFNYLPQHSRSRQRACHYPLPERLAHSR